METKYAIETTRREIEQAYIDFNRLLNVGRGHEAVEQAKTLAKQDANRLWNFLVLYTSSSVNYRETTPLLVVNALRSNWERDKETAFIAQAVVTLVNAPKGDSIAKFL